MLYTDLVTWIKSSGAKNSSINELFSDFDLLENAKIDFAITHTHNFHSNNLSFLLPQLSSNSFFLNNNYSKKDIDQKFVKRTRLIDYCNFSLLYSENESFIPNSKASNNSLKIRSYLDEHYQKKFLNIFNIITENIDSLINSLDSYLFESVNGYYLNAILNKLNLEYLVEEKILLIKNTTRLSNLVVDGLISSPDIFTVANSGELIYENLISLGGLKVGIEICLNNAAPIKNDVVIFCSTRSFPGLFSLINSFFERVFIVCLDDDRALVLLKNLPVMPRDSAIRICCFRELLI